MAYGQAEKLTYRRDNADVEASQGDIHFLRKKETAPRAQGPSLMGNGSGVEVKAVGMQGSFLTRAMDARDGVRLMGDNGVTANTERAHFDGATSVASGKDLTHVKGPRYDVDSVGFRASLKDEQFDFFGPVDSQVRISK